MNRIRFGLFVTMLLGAMWGFAGLLESLTQFGVGLAVAGAAVVGYGLVDFLEAHRDERIHRERVEVWERRDQEAA